MMSTPEQLDTLSVYVPPAVTRLALENPHQSLEGFSRRFHAATVFADISGFTPLAEALANIGVRGAEELTAILNDVFEAIIATIESHGGLVVKFGGDALSLIWPCTPDTMTEAIWRALQAAFAMQMAMVKFTVVPTSQGDFELRMKIGISAGELLEVHAGGEFGRWEYVLAGAPMANMSTAENHAEAGQIVLDEISWRLINGRPLLIGSHFPQGQLAQISLNESCVFGEEVGLGFHSVTHLWCKLEPTPLPPSDWSALKPAMLAKVASTLRGYIPGAIATILESGHKDMLAELKPMTVCFIGFSGIDYNNDPAAGSRLSNFMLDAQKRIYHFEGSVNKLAVGDKGSVLLVLFGAPPFFHEDDEIRAVACALALREVGDRHNLELRIGLATGPLFAGPLGAPQRREYSVIGDTVNLAARLMQKAEAGQVWVDRSVQSKTNRFFEYDDMGEVQLKGRIETRRTYQALGEKDQEELVMGYLLSNQELTGRDEELAVVDSLTSQVWANQGHLLFLSGEAGVGKSRLAAEIVRRWMTKGGTSHGGDCVSYGRQTPYLPWRGVIASIAGLSPRLPVHERLARLESLLHRLPVAASGNSSLPHNTPFDGPNTGLNGYWLERLPLLADMLGLEMAETDLTANLSEDLRRDNIFNLMRAIILHEAQQRPTLILLEDIHWSDELSMQLAVHLADELLDHSLMLVLAHRPLGSPVPAAYQKLRAKTNSTVISVDELSPEAGLKLVQSKLGVKTLPVALAELLHNKGQGNPFFIEELVNSLLVDEVIRVENGECYIIGDLNQLELPNTVQKVVLARIDKLDEADKVTLKVAAAIGRTFQRDLLETVHPWLGVSQANLDEQLARLQAEDFTRREVKESDLDFLFKHVITQEVAYETMLYSQRRHLHATIGAALESRSHNSDNEIVDLLAYHYARSDERAKALEYLQRAGQKALAGYANEAAISYFSEALTVAEETKHVKVQFDLLAGRERAYNRIGNRLAQDHDLKQMKQLARDEDNLPRLLETINRRLQLITNLGQYHEALLIAEEALTLTRHHDQPGWEARILVNLGITAWRQGDYAQARLYLQEALGNSGATEDQQLRATGLNYLGLIHSQLSDVKQARQDYQEAITLYRAVGDRSGEAGCANNLGLLESSLGRYTEARQYYSQALAICHAIGDRLREGISLNTLGQVETILGNYERATELLNRSLAIRLAIGDRRGEAFCLHDLGSLHLAQGRPGLAGDYFEQAGSRRHELGEIGNYLASLAALGEAQLHANQVTAAGHTLDHAVHQLNQISGSGEYPPQNIWWIYFQLCQARHQPEQAWQALHRANELVQAKARQIDDPAMRHSYLENVSTNAAIITQLNTLNSLTIL